MLRKMLIGTVIIGACEISEGMLIDTTSTYDVSPFERPRTKMNVPISITKPAFFTSWTDPGDIDSALCHIKYRGYKITDIESQKVIESINKLSPFKAIRVLFYAKHTLHDVGLKDIVDFAGSEIEKRIQVIDMHKSSFFPLLNGVSEDDQFVAKLSVALFESEFEDEANVFSFGYNTEIIKCAVSQMLTLKKENSEKFCDEAKKRLRKFGLHLSEFLE